MTAETVTRARTLADLPAPKGVPVLGNALKMDPRRIHLVLEEWERELGPVFTIRLGPQQVLVCADADMLQTALRERPEKYRRFSPIESVLKEMGGNGVFSVEGEGWRPQRQLVMHALASTNFQAFFPTMQAITERLHRHWRRAAEHDEIIDMGKDLVRYTVDVTTALAFGEDPNTLEQSGDVIQNHMAHIFPMIMSRINAPFPLWRYIKLPKDREFERSLHVVQQHVHALIERTRKRMDSLPPMHPHNLLEAMLQSGAQPGSQITDDIIFANVMTVLLAGEDTTAHTLAWTMYFLGTRPEIQPRMHAAAVEALGQARVCSTFDDVKRLDFFEAVAHEATRLKPVVPALYLETVTDTVLGDVALPPGTPIFFLLRPPMLDGGHFADPAAFMPERWATGHHLHPHDTRAYTQFGAGPRVCPGRHLAGVELRLVLSMLARNFTLELAIDPATITEVSAFTMRPSAMSVRLRPR